MLIFQGLVNKTKNFTCTCANDMANTREHFVNIFKYVQYHCAHPCVLFVRLPACLLPDKLHDLGYWAAFYVARHIMLTDSADFKHSHQMTHKAFMDLKVVIENTKRFLLWRGRKWVKFVILHFSEEAAKAHPRPVSIGIHYSLSSLILSV